MGQRPSASAANPAPSPNRLMGPRPHFHVSSIPSAPPPHDTMIDELKEVEGLIELTKNTTVEEPELYKSTAMKTIQKLIDIIEKYKITETQGDISKLKGKLTALNEYEKNVVNNAEIFNGSSTDMSQYVNTTNNANNANNAKNAGTLKRLKRLTDELLGKVFSEIEPEIRAISQEEHGRRKMGGGSRKSKKSHKKSHKKSKKSHRKN